MSDNLLFLGLFLVGGVVIGYFLRLWLALRNSSRIENQAQEKLGKAELEAKDIVLKAKESATSILAEVQREERERKQEIRRLEEHLLKKEDGIERQRTELERRSIEYDKKTEDIQKTEAEVRKAQERVLGELERVSGLSQDSARVELFQELQHAYKRELAEELVRLERDKRSQVEEKAVEIMTAAIQRYAHDRISDVTTSVVQLPDEEIKGKIIGREGRNIRTFERLTGVEVVVDETPESILLSSFDPFRRELAKLALEKLIKDGRIQPAKIEEKVEEARKELDDRIHKIGEEAAYEVGVIDLPKEIVYLLGRLNFRTSYGQNVLSHSVEMAHIASVIASELNLKVDVIKKACLVHDIGKAIDHDVEGTHVEIGRKLLKKYGVNDAVIRAMEAHHEEYPFSSPESYIVAAADAISAARPGARRDTLEKYLKRLEDVEKVVNSFEGVKQVYAVSAGREVRVFVTPEKIDDFAAFQLAKQIAAKIQAEVQYPGEIKVTVIREVKAVEYAK